MSKNTHIAVVHMWCAMVIYSTKVLRIIYDKEHSHSSGAHVVCHDHEVVVLRLTFEKCRNCRQGSLRLIYGGSYDIQAGVNLKNILIIIIVNYCYFRVISTAVSYETISINQVLLVVEHCYLVPDVLFGKCLRYHVRSGVLVFLRYLKSRSILQVCLTSEIWQTDRLIKQIKDSMKAPIPNVQSMLLSKIIINIRLR